MASRLAGPAASLVLTSVAGAAIPVYGPLPADPPQSQALPSPHRNFSNNIMLTGYWPPTGEMIRQFSNSPTQNPNGWVGGNWEDRGYNIYSYFPEFPNGQGGANARGVGDFEIDYQDTTADWNRIVNEVKPVAIITFSWTGGRAQYQNLDWELEARNKNRTQWSPDYLAPTTPNPSPPDNTIAPNATRFSSLPMEDIREAVNQASVGVNSYIDDFSTTYGGSFLSEFIGYHGVWYHDQHSTPFSDDWNIAAGHIHVGQNVTPANGKLATEVTLRVLTDYLDSVIGGNAMNSAYTGLLNENVAGERRAAQRVPAPATGVVLALGAFGFARRRRDQ